MRPAGESFAVPRDAEGLEALAGRLAPLGARAVAVEATGGFETVVATSLGAAGLPLIVVNPAQVRAFARALGKRAKTDPIDAAVIARFVEATRPEIRRLRDAETQDLTILYISHDLAVMRAFCDPADSWLVIVDTVSYARKGALLARKAKELGIPLIVVTDRFSHWALECTDLVLEVNTYVETFRDSTAGLSVVLKRCPAFTRVPVPQDFQFSFKAIDIQ